MKKDNQKELGHAIRYGLISLFCLGACTASMCDKSEANIYNTIQSASVMGISLTALVGIRKLRC